MLCTWFEHVKIKIAVQAGLLKYANQIVVAQKRPGRSKKMWDEMLVDEIKKSLEWVLLTIRTFLSHWRGCLRDRPVRQDQPSGEENRLY